MNTAQAIAGVFLRPLRIIPAHGGPVLHMLKADLLPAQVGEIYFSEILPGCIKAWKRHSRQNQLFAVPSGEIRIVLHDARADSPTFGQIVSFRLGRPNNYNLLSIPPGVWYGFQATSDVPALICNCVDIPHDPAEGEKLPQDSPLIPFRWT